MVPCTGNVSGGTTVRIEGSHLAGDDVKVFIGGILCDHVAIRSPQVCCLFKRNIKKKYRISRRATRHVSRQRALHFAGKCVVVFIGGICEYLVIASLQACCPIEKVLQVEQTSYTVHVTARSPTIRGRRYQSLYTQHSMRPWGYVVLQRSPVFPVPGRTFSA